MTPKSLLRHPKAVSQIEDFSKGGFHEVIDDPKANHSEVKRVILCTGKIYYDLLAEKEKHSVDQVALVRVEQLYPWPEEILGKILKKYKNANEFFWVQEEPRNMGAWTYIFSQWAGGLGHFQEKVDQKPIHYIGRETAATPAEGSHKAHGYEQRQIISLALGIEIDKA